MSPSKKRSQREAILHFWRQGIQTTTTTEIQSLTKIPSKTIYRNLKKIKETGDVRHKGGNSRIKKITTNASRAIGQYIRRNPSISGIDVSRSTVSRHLNDLGYQNALPLPHQCLHRPISNDVLNGHENIKMTIGKRHYLVAKQHSIVS